MAHTRKLGGGISVGVLIALALHSAVPPFATDMYTPAFPQVTSDLGASSTLIGLTLTAFFIGMGLGQVAGGAASDQRGRRVPMIVGGLVCTLGSVICALAPSVWLLIIGRLLQGLGGGAASAVGRAVVVDLTRGDVLARMMSILMAIGGLAPMIAPVFGGLIVSVTSWRVVFWALMAFGLIMMGAAWKFVPESLPAELRHGGGLRRILGGVGQVVRIRRFVAYVLTSSFSGFCMFAYVSNSSFIFQDHLGLSPSGYSLVFAMNALCMLTCTLLNARLVGWFSPRRLMAVGLSLSGAAVLILAVSVFAWGTPLVPTAIGFALLMSGQAFIFGFGGRCGCGRNGLGRLGPGPVAVAGHLCAVIDDESASLPCVHGRRHDHWGERGVDVLPPG